MTWNKHTNFTLATIIFLGLIMSSCKTKKAISSNGFQNEYFGIAGLTCSEIKDSKAMDSQIGTLDCGDISFTYDYGKYSHPGPITPKEEFRRSFDSYHHIRFFKRRMIDPKVFKIFLDSVEVIDVRRKIDTDKLLFDCDPCNTVAELTFKGYTHYYPLTLSEDQLSMKGYSCTFEEKDTYIYKYFQEDNALPGIYISPKKNRHKKKNSLSLIVTKTTRSNNEIAAILKNVYLVK